jgi:hypothetical protein
VKKIGREKIALHLQSHSHAPTQKKGREKLNGIEPIASEKLIFFIRAKAAELFIFCFSGVKNEKRSKTCLHFAPFDVPN